jgi:tetratricopeptide (TPR) repeat protein
MVLLPALLTACGAHRDQSVQPTLAQLRDVSPDLQEVEVTQGVDHAVQGYRRFLEETPEAAMTPEAMRRLADLELEKQFGIHPGYGKPREMAAPEPAAQPRHTPGNPEIARSSHSMSLDDYGQAESDADFERRTTAEGETLAGGHSGTLPAGPVPAGEAPAGPLEAIALYNRLLAEYPDYEHDDKVLYQMARAYDELGRTEEAIETMEHLIEENPHSEHYDEVQFRRGEFFFTRKRYRDAESAYSAIISLGDSSSYYELALYKFGWTLYKQELYEEALHQYIALLDYRVSIGYDFDQLHEEEDERRVADTYRVISFSFNNLGGPEAVQEYFSTFGNRSYEDRIYSNLGEHYLAKLRYDDAAKTYEAFVSLYPFHRAAPQFGMRLVDTFTQGGFPMLVLESKRDFASTYGLQAEYWRHFSPDERPEVLAYLKENLKDLATHYHAEYQSTEDEGEKVASYNEALHWYGDYLDSFPADSESPSISYQLAELLLENEDFGAAAKQYEQTAYHYPAHPQAAAAGYAAVYAYREQLKAVDDDMREAITRDTVASSLRFSDAFPQHEHAAAILGAAADDLYEMEEYHDAVATAQRVIDAYPSAESDIRRSAWVVVAHGSFSVADYPRAEHAYMEVLSVTPESDESHAALVENLAASIYRQGELARDAKDYRAAADHFLRIRSSAPTSTIRAAAEYDAGAALMELEDWAGAAMVLDDFRRTYPLHDLQVDATRHIAYAYKESGQLTRAADEYDRLSMDSDDPAVRAEALLVAGELYEETESPDRAFDVYMRYVENYPQPVEQALEVRFKIAEIHKAGDNELLYHHQLAEIVRIDAEAGSERSARTRTLAGRSALVLAEQLYREFVVVKLTQPFEVSLQEKQQHMDTTVDAMGQLVSYEIGEVTAAASYYMAETYFEFSRALAESERPTDLDPAQLQEYEMVLDEEAFPFEEKAIDFHEKNLELLHAGLLNEWTEKSLDKLVEMVPGRYARNELSIGFLGVTGGYEYRTPVSLIHGPPVSVPDATVLLEPEETAEMAPVSLDDIVVEDERIQN